MIPLNWTVAVRKSAEFLMSTMLMTRRIFYWNSSTKQKTDDQISDQNRSRLSTCFCVQSKEKKTFFRRLNSNICPFLHWKKKQTTTMLWFQLVAIILHFWLVIASTTQLLWERNDLKNCCDLRSYRHSWISIKLKLAAGMWILIHSRRYRWNYKSYRRSISVEFHDLFFQFFVLFTCHWIAVV